MATISVEITPKTSCSNPEKRIVQKIGYLQTLLNQYLQYYFENPRPNELFDLFEVKPKEDETGTTAQSHYALMIEVRECDLNQVAEATQGFCKSTNLKDFVTIQVHLPTRAII